MSTPMTAQQFVNQMTSWGIKVKPVNPNWATHNRNSKGAWGPVYGVGLHHTGSDDQTNMPGILYNGRDDLPGPLCHAGIALDGTMLLTGWGRCNHFGLGDSEVLGAVIREDYKGQLTPKRADVDGNAHFYGFEIMYSGEHPMSPAQRLTATRAGAAICAFHNWTPLSVIGHCEWQPGKWDPGYKLDTHEDMDAMRGLVAYELTKGANPTPPSTTPGFHVVKPGEGLWGIASSELGDGARWLEIVKLNPDVVHLVPGQSLTLPKK